MRYSRYFSIYIRIRAANRCPWQHLKLQHLAHYMHMYVHMCSHTHTLTWDEFFQGKKEAKSDEWIMRVGGAASKSSIWWTIPLAGQQGISANWPFYCQPDSLAAFHMSPGVASVCVCACVCVYVSHVHYVPALYTQLNGCFELGFHDRLCNPLYLRLFRSAPILWLNEIDI